MCLGAQSVQRRWGDLELLPEFSNSMNSPKDPKEVLETFLGLLAVDCQIEEQNGPLGLVLQMHGGGRELLGDAGGGNLEDLQLLLNRILQASGYEGGRVQLDVDQWRQRRDEDFLGRVRELAQGVRETGRSVALDPMNSYERRLVHQMFAGDETLATWSPPGDARMKRVTIRRRAGV